MDAGGGTDTGGGTEDAGSGADTGGGDTSEPPALPPEAGQSCNPDSPLCGSLQTCTEWQDGKFYCFCPEGQPYQGGLCEGDTTNVQSMCSYLDKDCTGEGFCYDVTSSTCDYLAEHNLTNEACDLLGDNKSYALCVSHTTDTNSPYLEQDECPLVQYWSNPTDFPIDCRCAGKFEDLCQRPYNLSSGVTFGEGPRMRDLAGTVHMYNGPVIGREWFVPVGWSTFNKKDQTMIFAIDLDTGARRHVSGSYVDPINGTTDLGAGPAFVNVLDMELGTDGMLYAMGAKSGIASPKVWKVDPSSGDRTLLFDEETAPVETLCPNGSTLAGKKTVQLLPEGWAMDEAGNHYFSIQSMPGPSIVKFGPDFASCEYLTRVASKAQSSTLKDNVGGGYDVLQFDLRAFELKDGKLYAVSDKVFLEVDLATGNRKLVSKADSIGGVGIGPINAEGLGDRWTRWDPWHEVFWTHGIDGASGAVTVNPTNGDRTIWPCWHPGLGILGGCGGTGIPLIPGYLNFGGMVVDPLEPHHLYFAHDLFSVVKYETRTGNAYILSL